MIPAIFSLSGPVLSADEAALFRAADPAGFILFQRNCVNPDQVRSLTGSLKETVGWNCPILIDQEGGRVARLKPPVWPSFRAAGFFGDLYADGPIDAVTALDQQSRALAQMLLDLGVSVNCAPVLDLRWPGAHDIIGDRSFSADPDVCGDLGGVVCEAFLKNGITPVIKHAPGHGRAMADSHHNLPIVDLPRLDLSGSDFVPFRAVSTQSYAPRLWMMTAHILYPQIDPDFPATMSEKVIADVLRAEIGFPGVLIADDMDMKALAPYGDPVSCAVRSVAAGCDLALNCFGVLKDMAALAEALPPMRGETAKRLAQSGFARYSADS